MSVTVTRVVVRVPAVEIGDHGDRRVANLRLARELGLRHVGHADHRIAEVLVGQALGERGELRPLHAHIGAARARTRCLRLPRPGRDGYAAAERPDAPWRHAPRSPCRRTRLLALMGAVDELIDQHEGAGRQLLLERAAGRKRDEVGDPCPLQHVDIGAVVDVGWREPVALVVARQERRSARPAISPMRKTADGSPHGLVMRSSRTFSRPGRS